MRKEKRNAFIGFKTANEAQEAIKYFDQTFIHSSKIKVKKADAFYIKHDQKVENKQLERQQQEQEKQKREEEAKGVKRKFDPFEDVKSDPEFKNFLQVQRNLGNFIYINFCGFNCLICLNL